MAFSSVIDPTALVKGRGRLWEVPDLGPRWRLTDWQKNAVLYDWATIVGTLLTQGSREFKLGAMYIEFENVTNPNTVVSAPPVTREDGISYYNGLSSSGVRDYLRVPMISGTLSSSDPELFPGGNVMTFFAQTQGTTGVHGKSFSNGANSKVFGAALVSAPDFADATQDLVFSRLYLAGANQYVKPVSAQLGLEWEVTLL